VEDDIVEEDNAWQHDLAAHERLFTNYRISKWGIGVSPICSICGNEDETVLHVLRDCAQATQIWIILVAYNKITKFCSLTCRDWVFDNLNEGAREKNNE
jgi:hypothetical protein